jgi:predicted DNA-binding transcriptional regulator AlpA
MTSTTDKKPIKLLFKGEVQERVGLSFPSIWGMMRNGTFPAGREVGGKTGWIESEIDTWIENRPLRQYKPRVDA